MNLFWDINFQKFKRKVKTDDKERIKFYKNSIISLWVPTLFIISLVGFTDLTLEQIGLTSISLNTESLANFTHVDILGKLVKNNEFYWGQSPGALTRYEAGGLSLGALMRYHAGGLSPISNFFMRIETFL